MPSLKDALDELWRELESLAELYLPPEAREAWLEGQDKLLIEMALEDEEPLTWGDLVDVFNQTMSELQRVPSDPYVPSRDDVLLLEGRITARSSMRGELSGC